MRVRERVGDRMSGKYTQYVWIPWAERKDCWGYCMTYKYIYKYTHAKNGIVIIIIIIIEWLACWAYCDSLYSWFLTPAPFSLPPPHLLLHHHHCFFSWGNPQTLQNLNKFPEFIKNVLVVRVCERETASESERRVSKRANNLIGYVEIYACIHTLWKYKLEFLIHIPSTRLCNKYCYKHIYFYLYLFVTLFWWYF